MKRTFNIDDEKKYLHTVMEFLEEFPDTEIPDGENIAVIKHDMVLPTNVECTVRAEGFYIKYGYGTAYLKGMVEHGQIDDDFHLLNVWRLTMEDGQQMFVYSELMRGSIFPGATIHGILFDMDMPMLQTINNWEILL